MINKVEVNDLRKQLNYNTTKLYSHNIWYLRDHLKKYYEANDQKRLGKLMKLCRSALYKIKNGQNCKVWKETFDYIYKQWEIDHTSSPYMIACKKAENKLKSQ